MRIHMRKITSSRLVQRTGFGLLEVVVVVGCLLLLLLIFLPWLLTARSSSRENLCLVRAKAVAEGVVLYSESHANDLPHLVDETGWPVALAPYMNLPGTMRDEKLLPQEDLKTLSVPKWVCPDDPRAGTNGSLIVCDERGLWTVSGG